MTRWNPLRSPAFLVAFGLLLVAALGLQVAIQASQVYLTKKPIEPPGGLQFRSLPTAVPGWERAGSDTVLSKEVLDELGTDNYLSRHYASTDSAQPTTVELHCAYYTGMIDTVPHVPERCFVGGGMQISGESRIVPVPIDLDRFSIDRTVESEDGETIYTAMGQDFQAVRMPRGIERLRMRVTRFDGGRRPVFAGYFFLANGGVVPSAEDVRLLAFNLKDDYAYYAKVQFTSNTVGSAEELAAVAGSLLDEMLPELMRRVPDWIEVKAGRYPPENEASGARASRD